MRVLEIAFFFCLLAACSGKTEKSELDFKTELKKPLTEISGIKADGGDLWAITDKPRAVAFKIDRSGKVIQEVTVKNVQAIDVEAVASDNEYIYIGDIGDNDGEREERQIIKFKKSTVGEDRNTEVEGEVISFKFSNAEMVDKKKKNNFDAEAMLSMGDSIYVFTKRREDSQTELFAVPKTAGSYVANSLAVFDSKGLVTDASINNANNEILLCGYHKGHKHPFILAFKNFKGNNFFNGKPERIELADKAWDWQIESISYTNDGKVLFACEETNEVKSTLYTIKREKLYRLNKKK
jgi:hypothetical protein